MFSYGILPGTLLQSHPGNADICVKYTCWCDEHGPRSLPSLALVMLNLQRKVYNVKCKRKGKEFIIAGIRAVYVGTGKHGRDGDGTGRERETAWFAVPDHDFPILPVVGFCSRRLPSRRKASGSRPDCFPSHGPPPSRRFPVPPSTQSFPSHPNFCKNFIQSRILL